MFNKNTRGTCAMFMQTSQKGRNIDVQQKHKGHVCHGPANQSKGPKHRCSTKTQGARVPCSCKPVKRAETSMFNKNTRGTCAMLMQTSQKGRNIDVQQKHKGHVCHAHANQSKGPKHRCST